MSEQTVELVGGANDGQVVRLNKYMRESGVIETPVKQPVPYPCLVPNGPPMWPRLRRESYEICGNKAYLIH